jgi:hypothetical protein
VYVCVCMYVCVCVFMLRITSTRVRNETRKSRPSPPRSYPPPPTHTHTVYTYGGILDAIMTPSTHKSSQSPPPTHTTHTHICTLYGIVVTLLFLRTGVRGPWVLRGAEPGGGGKRESLSFPPNSAPPVAPVEIGRMVTSSATSLFPPPSSYLSYPPPRRTHPHCHRPP